MKKFSFLGSVVSLAAMVAFLFVACQKEQQNSVSTSTNTSSAESSSIVAVDGTTINGLISGSIATQLRDTYLKTASKNATQYVKFSIKDLTNYIAAMQKKYGSDVIYVNFGTYDVNTIPNGNTSYIGRNTVFFTVNNNKSGGITLNSVGMNGDDVGNDPGNSLNHGAIYP